MAQPNLNSAPITRTVETIIRGPDGIEIRRVSAGHITIRHPDGRIEQRKLNENIVLVDGTNWNAGMLYGSNPIEIGACHLCRRPPYVFPLRDPPCAGLLRLSNAETCECGALCCGKHRRLCSDGEYRCTRCARWWFWLELLSRIFFCRR
jgi:hypothetical protein